ncbi:MAG: hypothetical protein PVJ57_16190 [Phycisphaerae bacterium]|jgi:hypothetical protein
MDSKRKTRVIIAVIGIVVIVAVTAMVARRMLRSKKYTVTGTIVRVDLTTRTAAMAVVHPKTGQTLEIEGRVPPECPIWIDEEPADLEDLRVGETVQVEGVMSWDRTMSANWVRATRAAETPATAPATSAPTTNAAPENP